MNIQTTNHFGPSGHVRITPRASGLLPPCSDGHFTKGDGTMNFRKTNRGRFLKAEGISRRADEARFYGTLPLAQAAKKYGVTQRDLRAYLGEDAEWHHEMTKGGRVKKVIYCIPLEDCDIEEIRVQAAERKALEERWAELDRRHQEFEAQSQLARRV